MSTTAINIVDVRRVAAAHHVTERRVVRAAEEAGVVLHRINGREFIDVADEDRVREHLAKPKS
jgi:hypothetical protein